MPRLKMTGATPESGKSLCHSCKHANIVKGQNCEERIVCDEGVFSNGFGTCGLVTFKVHSCSEYHPFNMPWYHEMAKIAWSIEARKRGPSGFGQPSDGREDEMVVTVKPPIGGEND